MIPMRLRIAIRNVFRNGGRTFLSVLMIAGAGASLILFRGFAENMLFLLQRVEIEYENGHMQAATHDYWEQTPGKRSRYMIPDYEKMRAIAEKEPGVRVASGRLSSFGLLSSGEITISAKALGIDVGRESGMLENLFIVSGEKLKPDSKLDVMLGVKLAKQLGVKVGDDVTMVGYTVDGVINALDLNVKGIFLMGRDDIDKFLAITPISSVQLLLDTQSVENVIIRLKKDFEIPPIMKTLQAEFAKIDPRIEIKDWYTLSVFYRSVESFYQVQDKVVATILISLVLLGIVNTVGMSIYERTGEIGTVRALGESEASIIWQFTLEGFILGLMGYVVAIFLAVIIAKIVNVSNIRMIMPNATVAVPIGITFVPGAFVEAAGISIITSTLATWWPALRASKMSIVEALKRNI